MFHCSLLCEPRRFKRWKCQRTNKQTICVAFVTDGMRAYLTTTTKQQQQWNECNEKQKSLINILYNKRCNSTSDRIAQTELSRRKWRRSGWNSGVDAWCIRRLGWGYGERYPLPRKKGLGKNTVFSPEMTYFLNSKRYSWPCSRHKNVDFPPEVMISWTLKMHSSAL